MKVLLLTISSSLANARPIPRRTLDAWRVRLSTGPTKSSVMVLAESVRLCLTTPCWCSPSWTNNADELLRRGERRMAACLSWTNSAHLFRAVQNFLRLLHVTIRVRRNHSSKKIPSHLEKPRGWNFYCQKLLCSGTETHHPLDGNLPFFTTWYGLQKNF